MRCGTAFHCTDRNAGLKWKHPNRKERNEHHAAVRCRARNPDSVGAGIMLNDLTTGMQVYIVTG